MLQDGFWSLFSAGKGLAAQAESDSTAVLVPKVPLAMQHTEAGRIAPAKWTGVLEDAAKQSTEAASSTNMQLVNDLVPGDNNIYVKESLWAAPGQVGPNPIDFEKLENSIKAAQEYGYHICLAVWPYTWGSRRNHTHWPAPSRPGRVRAYTTLLATVDGMLAKDFDGQDPVKCWVIGNEPNLKQFWPEQLGPNGEDAAAANYENLLAHSYDVLKKMSPDNIVIGSDLSSHGNNNPKADNASRSPAVFISDMGKAYKQSGRTEPIMDIFGYHPYALKSSESPTMPHPNSTTIGVADYPKLVASLANAFDGTAQPGSTLPILYDEFGVESKTIGPKAYLYHNAEPVSSGAVDESTQADYYRKYLALAACQRNVIGAFIFHTMDERNRHGWQSGPFHPDRAPKDSEPDISSAMIQLNSGGTLCPANLSSK